MKFIADFHIHSHFSRATSQDLTVEHLYKWAQLKGVQVVGAGDLTHPGWLQEIKAKLTPAEDGLFRLKDEYAQAMQPEVFPACQSPVRFILSGEISSIYKKRDRVRKIHNVVFAPNIETVEKIQARLERVGNIRSDGRPILGLDARDLLEMLMEIAPQIYLIPAHIWTPWFSLFGSKSGFDAIEECFEDLTPHIFALETGLSSDPPMNWRLSALDRYTLISNSDAHSPQKLAREANLFDTELSYLAIFDALRTGNPRTFLGTLEFFPEEGKYHYDGHRKCEICWDPKTTLQHNEICSKCGKPVTVGVMHRVEILADRPEGATPETAHPFTRLIPLPEILAEEYQVGVNSRRVAQSYDALLTRLGSELTILRDAPIEEIERAGGTLLAEGIRRMRCGDVTIDGGYDGEFGVIKLFEKQERAAFSSQLGFLPSPGDQPKKKPKTSQISTDIPLPPSKGEKEILPLKGDRGMSSPNSPFEGGRGMFPQHDERPLFSGLNPQQREAVLCTDRSLIIVAGPGTGKTRTLTHRLAYLTLEKGVAPENLLAITFTNKAAEEMADRLKKLVGDSAAGRMTVKTFHAFCAMILRADGAQIGLPPNFAIASEQDRHTLLKRRYPDWRKTEIARCLEAISAAKNRLITPETFPRTVAGDDRFPSWNGQGVDRNFPSWEGQGVGNRLHQETHPQPLPGWELSGDAEFMDNYRQYEAALQQHQMVDFDDLILRTIRLFETALEILQAYQARFRWMAVDEYQDLNFAQYRLLKLLKTPETNLCVIGDPDQAIYGFRGADRGYFLQFQADFPDAVSLHLSQNYRSTQMILDASQQVIAKSRAAAPYRIWSEFVSQTKLDIYHAPTHKAEAEYVVHEIEKMVGGTTYFSLDSGRVESHAEATRSFGDFAVLYRLNAQNQAFAEAFERSGIPYQIVGQTPLHEYKDIREILAYLWLLHNPEAAFYFDLIGTSAELFLQELRQSLSTTSVVELIERIRTQIAPDQRDEKRERRYHRLLARAKGFEHSLDDFLESMLLCKETDEYDPRADRVTLMTLHASKGLEFPVVFLAGCEEQILPYQKAEEICDVEEERRLFYVGMTRAKDKLILTHAAERFLFGKTMQNPPSRFVNDIETALKEMKQRAGRKSGKEKPDQPQLALF